MTGQFIGVVLSLRRNPLLSPFSTRRLFSREATFSFVDIAYHISKCDADKGKSRFARKKSPSGKRALHYNVLGTARLRLERCHFFSARGTARLHLSFCRAGLKLVPDRATLIFSRHGTP